MNICSDIAMDEEKPVNRLALKGMRDFSLSDSPKSPHVSVYVPGQKSQPASVRIFEWQEKQCYAVSNKSFYRADTVELVWNTRGTDLLILTSTKMSAESYYGDQGLSYLTTRQSGNSANVVMPRKGPIYQVAWRPNHVLGQQQKGKPLDDVFVVCYGFVPASVTVYGTDCEPRHTLGTGSWNQIHFNPHGNLLLSAGLGGLTGDISVWDFDRQELVSNFKTTDMSSVQWFNDGEHVLMATTTPRLRVNNGFGVWHYGGKQLFFQRTDPRETPRAATMDLPAATEHELYQVQVIPCSPSELPPAPKPKKFTAVEGEEKKPAVKYVPPSLRNRSDVAKQAMAAAYMHDSMKGPSSVRPSVPFGLDLSAVNSDKSKKRKKKSGAKQPSEGQQTDGVQSVTPKASNAAAAGDPNSAVPVDINKQIGQLQKKLTQIDKLKAEKAGGKKLQSEQVAKVATEKSLRKELAKLTLTVEAVPT